MAQTLKFERPRLQTRLRLHEDWKGCFRLKASQFPRVLFTNPKLITEDPSPNGCRLRPACATLRLSGRIRSAIVSQTRVRFVSASLHDLL
jgi:hypothetical protein